MRTRGASLACPMSLACTLPVLLTLNELRGYNLRSTLISFSGRTSLRTGTGKQEKEEVLGKRTVLKGHRRFLTSRLQNVVERGVQIQFVHSWQGRNARIQDTIFQLLQTLHRKAHPPLQ